MYGTGNYIQYPIINHNRKEYEKEHTHLIYFAVHQKLTQQCKSTTLQLKKEIFSTPTFKSKRQISTFKVGSGKFTIQQSHFLYLSHIEN